MGLTILERRVPGSFQRLVAERLGKSYREAIHVTLYREVRVPQEMIRASGEGQPNVVDYTIAAAVVALKKHPEFNALFEEEQLKLIQEVNMGIAFDTPKGLIVPVLKKADSLNVCGINEGRKQLRDKVMRWVHSIDDVTGGTFTVSNLGTLQVDAFNPIINPPQVAILGMGRVRPNLVLTKAGVASVEQVMTLSLSFDHRVNNGASAARFLGTLATCFESSFGLTA